MNFFKLNFREWLVEKTNTLFWVGPLMNDASQGIVPLAHKLKNRLASQGHLTDSFLWDRWKKFGGAVSGIERMATMGNSENLLTLFRNLKQYFNDICQYYGRITKYHGSAEEEIIKKHIQSAEEELAPQHMIQPEQQPQQPIYR